MRKRVLEPLLTAVAGTLFGFQADHANSEFVYVTVK